MDEPYMPKVNDYVVWDRGKYGNNEGWVYFVDKEYITIEVGVKPRPVTQCRSGKQPRHRMIHTLLVCHSQFWEELEYVKSRKSQHPQHYSECDD
jgi:hypothetical protein